MAHIEAAEYFEDDINPNMYAGAATIARIMTTQYFEPAVQSENLTTIIPEDIDQSPESSAT